MGNEFRVFVSSTSRDLGDCRKAVTDLLESYKLTVLVQLDYPDTVDAPFQEIDGKIASANLVLCLIGGEYGQPLPQHKLAGIPADASWTQYEYWKSGSDGKKRLVYFHRPKNAVQPSSAQSESQAVLQAKFITRVKEERQQGNEQDPFSRTFDACEDLVRQLQAYLDNGSDDWIEPFRQRRWEAAKSTFRANSVKVWNELYRDVFNGDPTWTPTTSNPPFIDNQKLELLDKKQNDFFLPHLKPAAFVVGRDTEAEALADTGRWTQTTLQEVAQSLLRPKGDRQNWEGRLFVVSGGGVGKTESLQRLGCFLNADESESNRRVIAFNLPAIRLPATSNAVLNYLVELVQNSGAFSANASQQEIERFLIREREQGRIALIVDGLDHIQSDKNLPEFLLKIQTDVENSWKDCPIVLSGRPYVIQSQFSEQSVDWQHRLLASRWQFCRPCEFTKDQQKAYLGVDADGQSRFDLIPREAQNILSVPRVLRYVRSLSPAQLQGINTPADVYCRAISNLVTLTMQGAAEALRIHPDNDPRIPPVGSPPRPAQVEYVMTMLAAAAFVMTQKIIDGKPNFNRCNVDNEFQQSIYQRVTGCGSLGYSQIDEGRFRNHFTEGLGAFNAVVSNGILEASPGEQRDVNNTLQELIWDNKSVQCFFSAYWLSKFARNAKCGDPDTFCSQMIWSHESKIDDYYELNRFLAEMPESHRDSANWLASIEGWFRPPAKGQVSTCRRSSEMMYRAWPTLMKMANQPAGDWWNTCYETIYQGQVSNHDSPVQVPVRRSEIFNQAQSVLDNFQGELQGILHGTQGPERQASAQDFINEDRWKTVPSGRFKMGFPPDRQGFPKKSEAYWRNVLKQVINGADPLALSKECNNPEWFRGAQGRRFRDEDVQWLCGVLTELAKNRETESVAEAGKAAMAEIEDNWRRKDESPAESVQDIAAFEMQAYPMLNRWFWLFAQGHQQSVRDYLNENVALQEAAKSNVAATADLNPNHDDHPVIFVSWFDCWAFCQWARWSVADPANSHQAIHYSCRLPHEPEWEFAARRDSDGAIPFEQRYWWGDSFYDDDNSPEPEPKSNQFAHAQGQPGRTRAPRDAAQNGFGFHDILGNVWEWAANVYFGSTQPESDTKWLYSRHLPYPTDRPKVNSQRAMRGGLWYFLDVLARCSSRFRLDSDDRDYKMGFRVVRERDVRK